MLMVVVVVVTMIISLESRDATPLDNSNSHKQIQIVGVNKCFK